MNRNNIFDWYLLFAKPIIYTCMLLGMKTVITHLYHYIRSTKSSENTISMKKVTILKFSLILGGCFLTPPAIDVMHLLDISVWILIIVTLLYSTAATYGTTLLDEKCLTKAVLKVNEIITKIKKLLQKKAEPPTSLL